MRGVCLVVSWGRTVYGGIPKKISVSGDLGVIDRKERWGEGEMG
jgi:hypothetical protein